jgi:hypothetical protein
MRTSDNVGGPSHTDGVGESGGLDGPMREEEVPASYLGQTVASEPDDEPGVLDGQWKDWTPTQRLVIERLLGRDQTLDARAAPTPFPSELAGALLRLLEDGLETVGRSYLPGRPLSITKHDLGAVFKCEGFFLAEEPFQWTAPKLRGTVVAKAMSMLCLRRFADQADLDLAEQAVEALGAADAGIGEFLERCSEFERGELTLGCADLLTKFRADWPPLQRAWIPRIESPAHLPLLGGRILLKARYDLALGHPGCNPADVVIVDFKAGTERSEHIEEVRHYALVEAVRTGTPPKKIAVHYVDGGYFREEEVTEDVLHSALRRTVEGVSRIHELWTSAREPALSPGSTCHFCPALASCAPGLEWHRARELSRP